MIKLTFSEFYAGDFVDQGYELYIVKDRQQQVMYIGISRDSVWNRWFGGINSHMDAAQNGLLHGNSIIGEVIQRRFPDSWNWHIELWTKDDCLRRLRDDLNGMNDQSVERLDLEGIESYLIKKTSPLYNVMLAGGRHEDPLVTDKLDEAYNSIFGSKKPTNRF
jgi:hypothetical protein